MKHKDKKVSLVNDARIKEYTKRQRSGSEQVFYTGNDSRDFDRYRAEGGNSGKNIEMHDKPDTIRITPPEKHYYAELIDGEWWWLDGCDQCNGRPRNGFSYIGECEKHNVCVTCGIHRSELKETPWGGKDGWQCKSCVNALHETEKQATLAAMPEEYDSWDYHGVSEITCPYCAYEFSDSWECGDNDDTSHDCPRCDNAFKATAVHTLTFDCERIEA